MSDTTPRSSSGAPQMLADALLRSLAGTSAKLRVTSANVASGQSELGLMATAFADVAVAPAVMRKLRPDLQEGGKAQWELLISATGVEQLINALDLGSAKSLFDLTLAVTVGEQRYLIEAFTSNEAFGQVYLYRLLLSEAKQQSL